MRTLLYRALILLAVFGLIFTPPTFAGMREADTASSNYDKKNYEEASIQYERAARLLPWRKDLWQQAGYNAHLSANYYRAIELLEIAYNKEQLDAWGLYILGEAYSIMGKNDQALEIYLEGFNRYSAYYYYRPIAVIYMKKRMYFKEKQTLEAWVASGEGVSASTHYRLGQLRLYFEPEHALDQFFLAASLDPNYDSIVETARATLNLASLETDESRRLVIIGRGLGLLWEWSLASRTFQQAIAADEKNAEAWAWLGEAEQHLGRDGRVELDKALSLGRGSPVVRGLRGLYWKRRGMYRQALAEYMLAAGLEPENQAWQSAIGEAYALTGDLLAALSHYQRATEIAPVDATSWRLLATFCAQYNVQVEEIGLPAAEQAITLAPDDPQVLDVLGWTYLTLNQPEEARYHLAQALELNPEFATAHLHYAVVSLQLDEWQTALSHLQQARDLDPAGSIGKQAQMLMDQYFP